MAMLVRVLTLPSNQITRSPLGHVATIFATINSYRAFKEVHWAEALATPPKVITAVNHPIIDQPMFVTLVSIEILQGGS